jgi:hypothetical protein
MFYLLAQKDQNPAAKCGRYTEAFEKGALTIIILMFLKKPNHRLLLLKKTRIHRSMTGG